jgi:hypothetical protein
MTSYSRRSYNQGVKGPGGFSRRDWYSSRAFNHLPPGPVAPRQTEHPTEIHSEFIGVYYAESADRFVS